MNPYVNSCELCPYCSGYRHSIPVCSAYRCFRETKLLGKGRKWK